MIVGLGDTITLNTPFAAVSSSDPLPTPVSAAIDTTTLQYQGGYVGQPLISTAGGYAGVATVPGTASISAQIGQMISNNILLIGVGLGLLLLVGKRR
jgi:hypothetical protein